ncbi:LysR family transcriptional regulator [Herbaspirillum huttiense]|jgi:DNA-binding transcriptional LysR family regulator|uniref:LysR substrate-binding domain-containing protein n=3 Tax=Herbaspirillum huttiense TaxID=863372 RepID=A0AAJ2LST6_9BURK|nr:LysR substrate-binding domain-containing protein [Herbaspirillum huttiense]MDR9838232.1 LysR substrate-binding domain-containing protein [Herbaspirillum huttiense]
MDLRHLRYFLTVADELHFARAAELLGIAPPTLSVQIQQLERQLQCQLFVRSKRSVALTSAGEDFVIQARAALARFDQAIDAGRRAGRGELGRVEVGYVGSAVFGGILQQQLSAFRQRWPQVLVHAREWPMLQLGAALEEGKLDIAFVRLPVPLGQTLQSHVLLRDRFCLALPSDHPLAAGEGAIRSRALAGEAFILPEQELGSREVWRRGGLVPRSVSRPGGLLAVLAEVAVGAGVAVVPGVLTTVVKLPNVSYRALAGAPIVSEVAAVYRRFERAPAVRNMIAALRASKPVQVHAATMA